MKSKRVAHIVRIVVIFIAVGATAVPCMAQTRSIALLDTALRTGGSDTQTFSLEHALHVAGIPFVKYEIDTAGISGALQHIMVVVSGRIYGTTFLSSELTALEQYVSAGGILVCQRMGTNSLASVFGITGNPTVDTRYALTWNIGSLDSSLRWFDDPLEQTISFATASSTINTMDYTMAGASPLAHFDDGTIAVSKYAYGNGYTYAVGFAWKDLILRCQLNMDGNASRSYSNGFEPTSDTIMLFLRGIYQSLVPFAAWKHTSPYYSQSTLMITHDADSRSSMEMIVQYAELESSKGVAATYNVTTHYLVDDRLSDFYNPYVNEIIGVLALNQKVGSHSVGHFPDFNQEDIVPKGAPGNNTTNYRPMWSDALGQAVGATVYGELEVSRNLLINDAGAEVWTFRSGHLAWNKYLIDVLDELGYRYDTSRSANDVLTNFPYRCLYETSYSGDISNIYEIPMTVSDVPFDETTYDDMLASWMENTMKNVANHAPTVLLIHPNRDWKLTGQEAFMDALDPEIIIVDMDTYGDYWRDRENLHYDSVLAGNVLTITIPDSQIPVDEKIGIVVDDGAALAGIVVQTQGGLPIPHRVVDWNDNSVVVSFRTMRGDFDSDWNTGIDDLILCLQVLAGLSPQNVNRFESVNADCTIKPNDAVFLLQVLAGLRSP